MVRSRFNLSLTSKTLNLSLLRFNERAGFEILAYKFAKEIWEALKRKYSTKDVGTKKYVVGRFLDYKMSDNKPITEQDHEY